MGKSRGLIFDIQGFSVHDGPGSRTTVFLSGCPLRCEWCANPEGREGRPLLLFSAQKCRHAKTGCGRCADACPDGALALRGDQLERKDEVCRACRTFACAKACYHEALRLSGRWYDLGELMRILRRDRQFWENGGVTFSGGEPLAQADFLRGTLEACAEESIHTAIETTAYAACSTFLRCVSLADFAFIDVKHMDDARHMEKTGVSNAIILNNITDLKKSGWPGRLMLRMPVVRGYNDTAGNIDAMIRFMRENALYEINILPFHRMGESKWTQLGLSYAYHDEPATDGETLERIQALFLENDIACYIGGDVIY